MDHLVFNSFSGNFFTRYFTKKSTEILPRRIRRIIYIGATIGILQDRYPESELIEKVNRKLKLAYHATGFLFPIFIGSFIWKKILDNIIQLDLGPVRLDSINIKSMSDNDSWKTGIYLAKHVPNWLQYGSQELMAADAHDTIVALKEANAA